MIWPKPPQFYNSIGFSYLGFGVGSALTAHWWLVGGFFVLIGLLLILGVVPVLNRRALRPAK